MANISTAPTVFQEIEQKPVDFYRFGSVKHHSANAIIVTSNEIDTLLNSPACRKGDHGDLKGFKVLRFLLRTDGTLVFGAEGTPSSIGKIPAHFQLTAEPKQWEHLEVYGASCLTAGNAYFDEKNRLCGLSNKSGDFRPPFDSLQFALPAFQTLPMRDTLIIQRLKDIDHVGYSTVSKATLFPNLQETKPIEQSRVITNNMKAQVQKIKSDSNPAIENFKQEFNRKHSASYKQTIFSSNLLVSFFRNSKLYDKKGNRKDLSFEDIIKHAQEGSNRSRKILVDMELMNKKGQVTKKLTSAYEAIPNAPSQNSVV
ncbi:MAG: hypothetical protein WC785_01155 [Tatlockia sp.]